MKNRILLILLLGLISCEKKISENYDKELLKIIYGYPYESFRMDTLNSYGSINRLLLSKKPNNESFAIGFIYNLTDSSFTPSPDKGENITIPCAFAEGNRGLITPVPKNEYVLRSLTNDSLTIKNVKASKTLRLSINEFKTYFNAELDSIFNAHKPYEDINLFFEFILQKQTNKNDILKIHNILFWDYYSNYFSRLNKTNHNLKYIIRNTKNNRNEIWNFCSPIRILFLEDNTKN